MKLQGIRNNTTVGVGTAPSKPQGRAVSIRCGFLIPLYRVGKGTPVTIFQRLTPGTMIVVSQHAPGRPLSG